MWTKRGGTEAVIKSENLVNRQKFTRTELQDKSAGNGLQMNSAGTE